MKRWFAPIVFGAGMLLAVIGFWWLWNGLDIVQVERGWSAVIGGATIMSAGFVIAALSAVVARLGDIAHAVAQASPHAPIPAKAETVVAQAKSAPAAVTTAASERDRQPTGDRQVVGRHVSGDSTYVMFSDGTVEAHTPDGVLHFSSLDELRTYADEREAATPERF